MEKTWKPTAAGILILIAVFLSIVMIFPSYITAGSDMLALDRLGVIVIAIIKIIIGIPVVMAGIYALRRERLVYVLICSLGAWILYFILGSEVAHIIYQMLPPPIDWLDPPSYIILFRDNAPLLGLLFLLVGVIASVFILLSMEEFDMPDEEFK